MQTYFSLKTVFKVFLHVWHGDFVLRSFGATAARNHCAEIQFYNLGATSEALTFKFKSYSSTKVLTRRAIGQATQINDTKITTFYSWLFSCACSARRTCISNLLSKSIFVIFLWRHRRHSGVRPQKTVSRRKSTRREVFGCCQDCSGEEMVTPKPPSRSSTLTKWNFTRTLGCQWDSLKELLCQLTPHLQRKRSK